MALWSTRNPAYKVGVILLFLASAFYLIGFATPFWFDLKGDEGTHSYFGLWMSCYYDGEDTDCQDMGFSPYEVTWMKAMQAMQCLGLIGLIGAVIYTVAANVRSTPLPFSRLPEVLALFSGVSGFIGCMIYLGKMTEGVTIKYVHMYLGWSFGVSLTGCLLFLGSAVVIFIASCADLNRRARPDAGGTVIAVNVMQGGIHTPVYSHHQGYPGGNTLVAAPHQAGYAPAATQGGVHPPVYSHHQGYPGGSTLAAAPHQAGYAPAPSHASYPPEAGYNPAVPSQASKG